MRRSATIGGPLLAALLFACGTAPPSTKHYRLAVPSTVTRLSAAPSEATVASTTPAPAMMVEEFHVDTAYDDPRIVYRTDPYTLEHYHYHRWSSPPGRLISETLRDAYARTGLFESVVPAWTSGVPLLLQGRVLAIEEVDQTEQQWLAHLELELRLVDAETEAVLWTHRAEEAVPLATRDPAGLAEAMSTAVARIVAATAPRLAAAAKEATEDGSDASDKVAGATRPE